jgi:hypothetical protein
MARGALIFVALLCIAAGATAAFVARPWQHDSGSDELAVEQATLRPGTIALDLVNDSEDTARLAQVIVNDAYADFDAAPRSLPPGSSGEVSVAYPWIEGESYEVEVLLATGNALMYEIEDAEPGVVASAA